MTSVATIRGAKHPLLVPDGAVNPDSTCKVCGNQGIAVAPQVMKSMLDRKHHAGLAREGFRFCPTSNCPIVYFDNPAMVYIEKSEVNKPVTVKDPGPDVPVCYCLQVSRRSIVAAVMAGTVHSSADAKRVTEACTGKACRIVNPAGTCCGDQLRDTVAAALAWKGASSAEVAAARAEDPGATCCGRTLSRATAGEVDIAGTASVHGESCCAIPVASAQATPAAQVNGADMDDSCCVPAPESERTTQADSLAKSSERTGR